MRWWMKFAAVSLLIGCGSRSEEYDSRFRLDPGAVYGLKGSVATLDAELSRVLFLSSSAAATLDVTAFPIGKRITKMVASETRDRLYLLSKGVQPGEGETLEPARLTVFSGEQQPGVQATFTFDSPFDGLVLDPQAEWALLYNASGLVTNVNELELVHLSNPEEPTTRKKLASIGGKPVGYTFTPALSVEGGLARRFVIVQRDSDIVLVDLSEPNAKEIPVKLPRSANGQIAKPEQIVVHDADPPGSGPGRIAVRFSNDLSVYLLSLVADGTGVVTQTNLVDVGGQPSVIDFVQTDQGLRLAALVNTNAYLIDPATSNRDVIPLPSAFGSMLKITADVLQKPDHADVALLYGKQTARIAFWTLGKTSGVASRSIEPYDLASSISGVTSIPGQASQRILESSGKEFYVLDLNTRQTFPMTISQGLNLSVAPDGGRFWAYAPNTTQFAQISLADLHPVNLVTARPIVGLFDIEQGDDSRALVALHGQTDLAATIFDAKSPSLAGATYVRGLAFRGLK